MSMTDIDQRNADDLCSRDEAERSDKKEAQNIRMMLFHKAENIVIRRMEPCDVSALCAIENDESEENRAYYERHLANQSKNECDLLIAEVNGTIAGHVFLYAPCRWGGTKDMGLPCVVDLLVFPAYRNQGIATLLMDTVEKLAVQKNSQIYLDVGLNSDYGAAQRFYGKRGYVPNGQGVYYKQNVCEKDCMYRNDDELTLCLMKNFTKKR